MIIEVTTTPRETLLWALTPERAAQLRELIEGAGLLVLEAAPEELDYFGRIPADERDLFDPARIIDVTIGGDAGAALEAVIDAGHQLRWHRWQPEGDRDRAWGVFIPSWDSVDAEDWPDPIR